jgi:hypothetical protein
VPFTAPENPRPVQAKFYVSAVELVQGGVRLKFGAVTRGDENKEWAQYTPSGSIEMFVKNELASDNFAPGQEWLLTFTPAPPADE